MSHDNDSKTERLILASKNHFSTVDTVSPTCENLSALPLLEGFGYKILIVDDSPYNLLVLGELLKDMPNVGIVDQALSGAIAISKVQNLYLKSYQVYDFILMDISMPIMDGPTTVAHLRELNESRKISLI